MWPVMVAPSWSMNGIDKPSASVKAHQYNTVILNLIQLTHYDKADVACVVK